MSDKIQHKGRPWKRKICLEGLLPNTFFLQLVKPARLFITSKRLIAVTNAFHYWRIEIYTERHLTLHKIYEKICIYQIPEKCVNFTLSVTLA